MRYVQALWMVFFLLMSCTDRDANLDKIRFELGKVDEEGLTGGPDGLRALSYEFCIPETKRAEVEAIDTTLYISTSSGRVGCSEGELLCIGHTQQAHIGQVLRKLASKPYISEIREAYFE